MTNKECLDIAESLGFTYILYCVHSVDELNARLYYSNYRYGEVKTKENGDIVMHSHHWKKQDELIKNIDIEKYKESLNRFILYVKTRNQQKKIRKLETDF